MLSLALAVTETEGKRPEMAAAVERCADVAIVTSDNPRGEDSDRLLPILFVVLMALRAALRTFKRTIMGWARVVDRREAIALGWTLCHEGDLLFVAGKGAEQTQEIAGERFPFDDRHACVD